MRFYRAACLLLASCHAVSIELGRLPPAHSLSTISRFYVYGKPSPPSEADSSSGSGGGGGGGGGSASGGEWLPSFGWGLWDVSYPLHARVITDGISVRVSETDYGKYAALDRALTNPGVLWLAVMKASAFWQEFIPFQNNSHFCCRQSDVDEQLCARPRELRLPAPLRPRVMLAPVALSSNKAMRTDAVFPLPESGAYYLLIANCMDALTDNLTDSSSSLSLNHEVNGKVYIESTHGFLSAIDVPKLKIYFDLSLATAVLALWWMLTITKAVDDERDALSIKRATESFERKSPNDRRSTLLPLPLSLSAHHTTLPKSSSISFVHNYLSLTLLLQLMESLMYYIYYSWENNSSAGASYFVEGPAMLSSVLKNVVGVTLVLALALGVYSIHERMPPFLKIRVTAFATILMITDLLKTATTRFHSSLHLNALAMVFCSAPVAIVGAGGCWWIWRAVNATIAEVQKTGSPSGGSSGGSSGGPPGGPSLSDNPLMFAKLVMLQKLRRIVVVAAALYAASTLAEMSMYFIDSENLWKYEYLFTDSAPATIFFLITLCVAIITRPSLMRRSYDKARETNVKNKGAGLPPAAAENLQIDTVQIVDDPRALEAGNAIATTVDDGNHETTGYRTFTAET